MKYLFLFSFLFFSFTGFSQLFYGYDIQDFLVNAVHPNGCADNYVIGLPDDSTWVNFNGGHVMTGTFGMSWTDGNGDDLLLETSYHADNYNVRLILSTGVFSGTVGVSIGDWTQIPDTSWVHLFADCSIGQQLASRWLLPLDFAQFGIGPGDLVSGIEITFLATGGAPDLAGVYIIAEPCNIFSLGPDRLLCDGNSITLNATTPNATYVWQDNSTNATYLVTEPGTYWVNVTVDDCTTVDTVHVADQSVPVNIGNDTSLCPGETLLLNATTPGAIYEWQNNSSNPTFLVSQPGTYWVIVTVDGCESGDTIEVDYATLPSINFGDDIELCEGETHLLNATIPGATYVWQDNSTGPTFLVSEESTYWVIATVGDCETGDTVIVNYNSPPPLDLGMDIALCDGDTYLLGTSFPGATYEWQDGSGDATFLVTSPGIYWVIVELNDCTISDTIEVEYYNEISVDLGNDITLCSGETITLDAATPGASYEWQDNSNQSTFLVEGPGIYWVTVEVNDCYAGDTIEIDFTQEVNISLGNDTTLCQGETLILEANVPGASYSWQNGSSASTFLVTQPGEYWVEINLDDCISIDTISVEYLVLSAIDFGNDSTLCEGESLLLNATTPGVSYTWQDNSGGATFLVTQPGNYWVTVNLESCSASDSINIYYNDIPLIALGNDTTLCEGESILLQVNSPGALYQWQDNSTGSTFLVTQSGTYWVEGSLGQCTAADTIQVSYISIGSIDLGNDTTLCEGNMITLDAFTPGASYQWDDNSTNASVLIDSPGSYWVNVSIGNCSSSDTILVDYLVLNSIDLGNDTTLCQQDELLLDATTSGGAYNWQDNSTSNIFNVTQPGIYWVTVQLGACSSSDTIEVDYITIAPVDIGNDTTLCEAQSLLLNANTPGATYEWQDNSTGPTLIVDQSGSFSVIVSVGNCDVRDTIQITFLEPASIDLGNDTTLCDGHSLVLDANAPGASFLWHDNSTGQTFNVTQPGTFWVEINLQDCFVADTITIQYHNPVAVNLGSDTTLCPGEQIILNAMTSGAAYHWQDHSTNPTFTVIQPGTYWVSIDVEGCVDTDTITITYASITPVNLGQDTSLCENQSLILDATVANASYTWQDNSSNSTFNVSQAGTYWVNILIGGCSTGDTIDVEFIVLPDIDLGNDTTLCKGEMLILNASTPGALYLWQDNSNGSTNTVFQQGIYWVIASVDMCTTSDSIAVDYLELLPVTLGNDTTLCVGEILNLSAATQGASYEWQDGSDNSAFQVNQPGTYWVSVMLDQCTVGDTVAVDYKSIVQFDLGRDTTICEGQSMILAPVIAGEANYVWQDNSVSETYVVNESGEYWLNITNDCGSSSDSISIILEDCRCYLYVPNVFSPNNDQVNDQLIPSANCEISEFLFMVFDRAGNQFFMTNTYGHGWDGTYKNQFVQVGVYAYVIIYSFKDGRKDSVHGDITVVR